MAFCSSSSLCFVWLLSRCTCCKVEFPQTSMWWSSICIPVSLGVRVCSSCQQGEHLAVLPQKGWKKWKGRLFYPGWEVEKPETTKKRREELYSFSRYFIWHPGHQGSWVSEYRLEIHSDLVTDGQWYLHVILLLLLLHQCLKVAVLPAYLGNQKRQTGELLWRQHWWNLKLWLHEDNHCPSNLLEALFASPFLLQMMVVVLFSCSLMSSFEIIVTWYLCSVPPVLPHFSFCTTQVLCRWIQTHARFFTGIISSSGAVALSAHSSLWYIPLYSRNRKREAPALFTCSVTGSLALQASAFSLGSRTCT